MSLYGVVADYSWSGQIKKNSPIPQLGTGQAHPSVGWKEMHAVAERSPCMRIQMRLPWPSVFIILIL